MPSTDLELIKRKLSSHNVNFVTRRDLQPGQYAAFFAARTLSNQSFIIEIKFKEGMNISKVSVRSNNKALSELCKASIAKLIV